MHIKLVPLSLMKQGREVQLDTAKHSQPRSIRNRHTSRPKFSLASDSAL
jgi:hypothetical protein